MAKQRNGTIALVAHVDGSALRHCLQLLATPESRAVRLSLRHAAGQAPGYAHLQLIARNPSGWWEHNGLAVRVDGDDDLDAAETVIELGPLLETLERTAAAFADPLVTITWRDEGVTVQEHELDAQDDSEVTPPPDVSERVEQVVLPSDTPMVALETRLGRVELAGPLLAHLRSRNIAFADLADVEGQPVLVGQASLRAPANTLPVTIAPLMLISRTDTGATATPDGPAERRRGHGNEVAQLLVVSDPTAPRDALLALLDDGIGFVRRRAAAHPGVPPEVIDSLLADGTVAMRIAAATNPRISPESAARAARDQDARVRAAAASNRRTTPDELEHLVSDGEPDVRASVARNVGLPRTLAERLAVDAHPAVREAVASNEKAPAGILAPLARDTDPRVCLAVARNPAAPSDTLRELSGALPYFVVGNPSAPADVLTAGALASDLELRLQAAGNPSTPSRALARLARDADRRVLQAAGTNPNAPAAAKRRAATSLAGLDATLEHSLRKAGLEATVPANESEEAAAD